MHSEDILDGYRLVNLAHCDLSMSPILGVTFSHCQRDSTSIFRVSRLPVRPCIQHSRSSIEKDSPPDFTKLGNKRAMMGRPASAGLVV